MEYRFGPRRFADDISLEGESLQISEDLRRCVVFLGWQEEGAIDTAPIDPKGTAFIINGGDALGGNVFLVTARHVADKLHTPFVIRMNKKGGGAKLFHIEKPSDIEWCYHDDKTVDLAVAPFRPPSWADERGLNAGGLLEDREKLKDIDAGATVCVIGLFHLVYGTRENLPITHIGHVAMLPGDELISIDGVRREGYLVQANAISGCSGSPVMAARQVVLQSKPHAIAGIEGSSMLLGVWSASWKVQGSEIVAIKTDDDDERGQLAPLGMGFVTPLTKLIDIIWSDKMKEAADRLRKKIESGRSPTFDSSDAAPASTDENPKHREDFKHLLGAAARKQKPAE